MALTTPHAKNHDGLSPLASRYVDVEDLPWVETKYPGVRTKVLMEDKETGLFTALFQWDPGSELPWHEHVDIEQTYVLEGRLVDEEGEVTAGNFVWRPAGSRHVARAPDGALLLGFLMRPNRFIEQDG